MMPVEPDPPLKFPHPWPPPDRPTAQVERIPLIGPLLRGLCGSFTGRAHWECLEDLHDQIVSQLQSRRRVFPNWPVEPAEQLVLSAVQEAVAFWKGLDGYVAHPDDPAVLLFWGPRDDLSPMSFHLALQTRLKKTVPDLLIPFLTGQDCFPPTADQVLSSRRTLRELLELYAGWINSHS
ncbi:hypothetical protein [Planctomicrobium sp. SH664]|uniref:hypothetical protein n=1 Tax=Planctomicrobium sp. SH664 TaxID=3448125 RepID=UPI003F5C15B1